MSDIYFLLHCIIFIDHVSIGLNFSHLTFNRKIRRNHLDAEEWYLISVTKIGNNRKRKAKKKIKITACHFGEIILPRSRQVIPCVHCHLWLMHAVCGVWLSSVSCCSLPEGTGKGLSTDLRMSKLSESILFSIYSRNVHN